MMRRFVGAWLRGGLGLVLAAGAGCGAARAPRVMAPPLGNTITAIEVTEGGDALIVPPHGVTEVDVNSTIYLQMNDERIAEEMAAVVGLDRDDIAALARRTELLHEVTRAQTAAVVYLKKLSKSVATQRPITEPELKHLGLLEQEVVARVEAYAREAGMPASELFDQLGYRGIDEERNRVLARSAEIAARVESVRWRVQAGLSKEGMSVAIHLPNYDDLPEEALRLVFKLAPGTAAGELRRQLEAAALLSRSLDALLTEQQALEEQVLLQVQRELRALRILLLDELPTLDLFHRGLVVHVGGIEEGVRLKTAIEGLRDMLRTVQTQCRQALAALDDLPGAYGERDVSSVSRADALALLGCADLMSDLLDAALPEKVAEIDAAVRALQARIAGQPDLLGALGDMDSVIQLITVYDEAEGTWRSTFTLVLGAHRQLAGPMARTDAFIDRTLAEIANTAIQLTRTRRSPGDVVFYRAALVERNMPIKAGLDHSLRVVQAGLRLDVSAAVNFLRPRYPQEGEDTFRAAPAITAALHYHDWRGSARHAGNRVWNFLDPGLGVHVIYPDLGVTKRNADGIIIERDPAAEVGLGGVVQLFGDFLQLGYGYDLQVRRSYWYVGFGFQTLTDLGISLPLSRGITWN